MPNRDDFSKTIIEALGKRASFVCSNPDCRKLTIFPSIIDESKYTYIGKAAHITAAASGGPRYDINLTPEERSSINNAIFLCSNCADMIDKNNGIDFTVDKIKEWKKIHEEWILENLNKKNKNFTTLDGEHITEGKNDVIGIDIYSPTFFNPGTKSLTKGKNGVTGIRINNN